MSRPPPWEDRPQDGSFARQYVITRVRNHDDDTQWVDVANITAMIITRPSSDNRDPLPYEKPGHHHHQTAQKDFQRFVWRFQFLNTCKPEDTSETFTVKNEDELKDAVDKFADEHPD